MPRIPEAIPTDPKLLKGELAIVYKRWSNKHQGKKGKNSNKRQTDVEDKVLEQYGMVPDPEFDITDDGRPASDGTHRKKGNFGKFLKLLGLNAEGERIMLPDGTYKKSLLPPGKKIKERIFLCESIDRIAREGSMTSEGVISGMVRWGNIIIMDGQGRIWDRAALEGPMGLVLKILIQNAHFEVVRLGEKIGAAMKGKREDIAAYAKWASVQVPSVEDAHFAAVKQSERSKVLPRLLRIPPWFTRGARGESDALVHDTAAINTVQVIYAKCLQGSSIIEIRDWLNNNRDIHPVFGGNGATEWAISRVRAILKDDRVLGYITCKKGGGKEYQDNPALVREKVMDGIIEDADYYRVEAMITRTPVGRSKLVTNLFVGNTKCSRCNGSLVVVGSGTAYPHRAWECRNHRDFGDVRCANDATYPVRFYEARLLHAMIGLADTVPQKHRGATEAMLDKLAKLETKIASRRQQVAALEAEQDREYQDEVQDQIKEHNRLLSKELLPQQRQLAGEIASANAPTTREQEVFTEIKEHMAKALDGDFNARTKVQTLLQALSFKIVSSERGLVLKLDPHGDKRIEPGIVYHRVYLVTKESLLWGRVNKFRGAEVQYRGNGFSTQFPTDDMDERAVTTDLWSGRGDKKWRDIMPVEQRGEWHAARERNSKMTELEKVEAATKYFADRYQALRNGTWNPRHYNMKRGRAHPVQLALFPNNEEHV